METMMEEKIKKNKNESRKKLLFIVWNKWREILFEVVVAEFTQLKSFVL